MKCIKRIGIGIVLLPFILILIAIIYEIFGMGVNHMVSARQTKRLRAELENAIPDIEVLDAYSETGNISGTGNHVECLSVITFATEMTEDEIKGILSKESGSASAWKDCRVCLNEDGFYTVSLETAASFADNIEGH